MTTREARPTIVCIGGGPRGGDPDCLVSRVVLGGDMLPLRRGYNINDLIYTMTYEYFPFGGVIVEPSQDNVHAYRCVGHSSK